MTWTDMEPAPESVLLEGFVMIGSGEQVKFCIDRMLVGKYRATVGDLFHSTTVCTNTKLENLLIDFQASLHKVRYKQSA